jgi:low affinity Fe/Cu permease
VPDDHPNALHAKEASAMPDSTDPLSESSRLPDARPVASRLELISQKVSDFVSGHTGTLALLGVLGSWVVAIPIVGWSRAYEAIDEFITVASFILLFLIQRSQNKGMLSLQVKLNELLAAAHRASPELINVEDRTESEVQEIHDRFQEIQQRGPGAHSISDILDAEQEAT